MSEELLEHLGWDPFFRKSGSELIQEGMSFARITAVSKNKFSVSDGLHEMLAEPTGKFLFASDEAVDLPTVGDWVLIQAMNDFNGALIHAVLPRKTVLKRKEPGKRINFQLIAANIDYGLVVQSAEHVNLNLLDRYFVMLNESGIKPIVIISKTDLVTEDQLASIEDRLLGINNRILFTSSQSEEGTVALKNILFPGKTYCLLGQSGVGKSSLLNRLLATPQLEVGEIREKDGRGRHTTVRRQLVRLETGSLFIDTPGIRELGNFDVQTGMDQTFEAFASLSSRCRFSDCSHTHEEGCAVIAALDDGEIDEDRYQNYLKLKKETEFYDLSHHDKRKRDKAFGKMVRNHLKFKRRDGKH